MRAPPKVRIALHYLGMCNCVEQGWDRIRDLSVDEQRVKRNALQFLDNYFLGEFDDVKDEFTEVQPSEQQIKKIRKGTRKKGL